jgi:phage tail sheath protein FI
MYRNETQTSGLPTDKDTEIICSDTKSHDLSSFGSGADTKLIKGEEIAAELITAYGQLSDLDQQQIDIVCDAGLSSIAQFCDDNVGTGTTYSPATDTDANDVSFSSLTTLATWLSVVSSLDGFCKNTRRDCMTIVDVPRQLALKGEAKIVRPTNPSVNFDTTLANRFPLVSAAMNSNYLAPYGSWMRVTNPFTGSLVWIPQTCKMAGIYVNVDYNFNYWDAPYGLERGLIDGVVDVAFQPNPKQEDLIYSNNINYVKRFPIEGFVAWGQKTGQKVNSAYDRVNVRRMVLRLERYVYRACRPFIGKVNNTFTRRQLLDIITPEFKAAKNAGGLYDYLLICDDTNNTGDVIDANELKLAVYIQPVRVADFIRATFFTTRTGVRFEELIGATSQ